MNQSIKLKLLMGFSAIVLLLVAVSIVLSGKLSESDARIHSIVEVSARRVSLSKEILIQVLDAGRHEKNIILEKDPAKKDHFKNRIDHALSTIDRLVPELQGLADEKGTKILDEFKNTWKDYKSTLDEIILLAVKNDEQHAFELSSGKGLKTRDAILGIMDRLVVKNEKGMADDKLASDESYTATLNLIIALVIASVVLSIIIAYWIIQGITKRISFIAGEAQKIASREFTNEQLDDTVKDEMKPIVSSLASVNESFKEVTQNANTVASGNFSLEITPRSEKDTLGQALRTMTLSLRKTTAENEKHNWLTAGQNQLNEALRGDRNIDELSGNIITFLCNYAKANVGAVYVLDDKSKLLHLTGQYALPPEAAAQKTITPGDGLIGQAAREQKKISLQNVHEAHLRITSAVLDARPKHLLITPFSFEGKALGVVEMGSLSAFTEVEQELISSSMESIGISVNSAMARKRIQELLEETQVQSEELQSQQEELRQINEELEEQAQNLKQQQEELQMTNEELEEQTQALEMKNREVETARTDIEQKTRQLEISSRYKSEFLANMSHELRTPLNSLLILSKDLADNKKKNLSQDQVESAVIINKSGYDLLGLINEVLDLSKIEAGKMVLNVERIQLKDFLNELHRTFRHQTENKGLKFSVTLGKGLPDMMRTDSKRLDQVMKNLLSNAIKFTEEGTISIVAERANETHISISVKDTGIGVAEDKQMAIFEAFHQGDGSTSRKYGGTGLGLSISRELTKLLGGEIKLTSKVDEGSVFTLTLPIELPEGEVPARTFMSNETPARQGPPFEKSSDFFNYPSMPDDREKIYENDKVLLVIEDDQRFAEILLNQAHEKKFKCLAAATGEDGLMLAEKYRPQAIILDIDLPGINGHQVLSELKANPVIRHIPVHIISVNERTIEPVKEGAIEYLTKPVNKKQLDEAFNRIEHFISRKMKNLLIVEDDDNSRKAMKKLIGNGDVKCFEAKTGKEAIATFTENHIDCIVLDLGLPDTSGFELIYKLEKTKDGQMPPIIIYTGKDLSKEENDELQKYAETIIIKGVKSEERLLDETALFLHRTISSLPESKQKMIAGLYDKDRIFVNKKILVVDDDMRNVFALSKVLKEHGMEISKAENGIIALNTLDTEPGIDLVLMDIMMPEMDGYEAMRKIRSQVKFKRLPVIALTAKAMRDDRQKCIDAGANDYIPKPVDIDRLLSLMRVWLSK